MRILVAPDSFKGSLSAMGVAQAMERGILSVVPDATVIKVPVADGGEGTVEALVCATGGRLIYEQVLGPLELPTIAAWGVLGDGVTAVIEMAAASGLTLIASDKRDPLRTTTYGTGQLIKAALDQGLRKIIIGIGGSATNDGGAGMAQALGVRFLDAHGAELAMGGAALARLDRIDISGLDPRLSEATLIVACDVDNPLCGPRGASAVYGMQKGATERMVTELDTALAHYARVAAKATGKDVARLPGAGAAGGLGAGILFFTEANLKPGIQIVLEACEFSTKVKDVDLVMTGEGRTDAQTAMGKAPVGVADAAAQFNVPVVCLSGGLGEGSEAVLSHGIAALMSIVPGPISLEECMGSGAKLIQDAASRVCRLILLGRAL